MKYTFDPIMFCNSVENCVFCSIDAYVITMMCRYSSKTDIDTVPRVGGVSALPLAYHLLHVSDAIH